jgi:hypothetical protein
MCTPTDQTTEAQADTRDMIVVHMTWAHAVVPAVRPARPRDCYALITPSD